MSGLDNIDGHGIVMGGDKESRIMNGRHYASSSRNMTNRLY